MALGSSLLAVGSFLCSPWCSISGFGWNVLYAIHGFATVQSNGTVFVLSMMLTNAINGCLGVVISD